MKELLVAIFVLFITYLGWVTISITSLQADYSDIATIREDVTIIKTCLINGVCREK